MYNPELERQIAEAQDVFVWEAPEYERYERGPRWYIVMSIIAVLFVAYAIWTANYLFAFLILLAAIILVLAGNEHPKRTLVQVGHNGVVWQGNYIPFERFRDFAIIYQPPNVKVLYLDPRNIVMPRLRIDIGNQDPLELREHLRRYLEEDLALRDEHASDMLARLFRL